MQELCFYTFLINPIQSYTVKCGNRNYMEMCKHEPCGRQLHGPLSESLKIYYSTEGGLGPAAQNRTRQFNTQPNGVLGEGASAQASPRLAFIQMTLQGEWTAFQTQRTLQTLAIFSSPKVMTWLFQPPTERTVSWGIGRLPGKRRYEQPDFSSPITEELILQMKYQGSCVWEAGRAVSGTEGTLSISIIFPRKPIRLRQVRATQFRGRLWCKERGQGTSFWASECRWPWEPVYTEVTGRQGCWRQLAAWRLDEGRGDRHVSFLFFSLQFLSKSFDFCSFFFKIPDYFEQCCEQIKDAFLGHNNILLISFKKLIRLQRHSTERVHGPLPWIEAENPHVNQPVIDESVRDAGACLKQMSNIPELGIYTVHSLSIYSFPHV